MGMIIFISIVGLIIFFVVLPLLAALLKMVLGLFQNIVTFAIAIFVLLIIIAICIAFPPFIIVMAWYVASLGA